MKVEPILLLAGCVALTFALLVVGFVVAAASGAYSWQALATTGVAILIVAGGLLYAWRLGAPAGAARRARRAAVTADQFPD